MRTLSHDDDDEACIRIGDKYQAHIPSVSSILDSIDEDDFPDNCDECLWDPADSFDDKGGFDKVDSYVDGGKKLGWPEYESLTVLHACRGDMEKAKDYLDQLEPETVIDMWSAEDRATFESGFSIFGKNFLKINTWLKHKTVPDLVEFYYYLKSKSEINSPRIRPHTILHNVGNGLHQITPSSCQL